MNSSPVVSWKDAAEYFTFAHNPDAIGFILTLSVIVTCVVIGSMIAHEKRSFSRIKSGS